MDAPLALTGLLSRSSRLGAMPSRRALPPRCNGEAVLADAIRRRRPCLRPRSRSLPPRERPRNPRRKPTLVVLVTIDQFRADYLDRFGPQMTGGIARMMRDGARFTDAHHDHAITETAPGHATLLSGRFPRSTGIMMNSIGVSDRLEAPAGRGVRDGRVAETLQGHHARRLAARRRSAVARLLGIDEGSRRDPADRHLEERRVLVLARRTVLDQQLLSRFAPVLGHRVQRPAHGAELRRQAVDAPAGGQRVPRAGQRRGRVERSRLHLPARGARPTGRRRRTSSARRPSWTNSSSPSR